MIMNYGEFVKPKGSKIDAYIGLCLLAPAYAHSAHFTTKSYAKHKTFDKFFSEMPELIDTFGEIYIGSDNVYVHSFPSGVPMDMKALLDLIISQSDEIYSGLCHAGQSAVDNITTLCKQTKYLMSLV